jgi:enoyl-CoA hydratase
LTKAPAPPAFGTVIYSKAGRIATITLNRPEKLNALSADLLEDMMAAFEVARQDDDVRCVILKGAGRAFSVGHEVGTANHAKLKTIAADRQRIEANLARYLKVWDFPKPVVAQIHGYCIAAATLLVLCCDLAVIADNARVRWPSIPLGGGMIGAAATWIIGPKKAKEMSFIAGSEMSGAEAQALGWANHAVPEDELEAATLKLCRKIAKTPPDLLHMKKLAINRIMDMQGFRTGFMFGAEWDAICHFTDGIGEVRARIKEHGLKETIKWFESQE